jgi:hypothetical protein
MPYTDQIYGSFRFIAYEVATANKVSAGEVTEQIARLPLTDPPLVGFTEDARTRLRRLAAVVDFAARELASRGDSPATLKIFVVPEFYFRPDEGHAYTSDEIADVIACFERMFVSPDFQHWLFVCGTHLYWRNYPGVADRLYFNTAYVVKGGHVDAPQWNIQKRFFSPIDIDPGTASIFACPTLRTITDRWVVQKQCMVSVDNLRIGFEICLDHGNQVLAKMVHLRQTRFKAEDTGPLQLQVLVSSGQELEVPSIAVPVGGYVLRNDGSTAYEEHHSEMRQVVAGEGSTLAFGARVEPQVAIAVPDRLVLIPDEGDGSDDDDDGGGGGWDDDDQEYAIPERIVFYPITPLPYK